VASIFSRIIAGEIPCHRVWEDEQHIAFLDIRPVQPGHTLVVPKREIAYLFDLSAEEQAALWNAVRIVEGKMRAALRPKRVVLAVVGWEVPHVHVHLVPTNAIGEFPFPGACRVEEGEMVKLAARVAGGEGK
jgi:histidine triad (HIT) family protein